MNKKAIISEHDGYDGEEHVSLLGYSRSALRRMPGILDAHQRPRLPGFTLLRLLLMRVLPSEVLLHSMVTRNITQTCPFSAATSLLYHSDLHEPQ